MSRVLLFGATGLIGGRLLSLLLADDDISSVTVAGRRHPDIDHAKLHKVTLDLDALVDQPGLFDVDLVFCCLGTTLRQAGSKEAFRRVDYQYVVAIAHQARLANVDKLLVVSAVNANPKGVGFYAKTKGQMEQDVSALGLRNLVFMQPSLLEGERNDERFGEQAGQRVMALIKPLVGWSQASWLSVSADDVAVAMLAAAKQRQDRAVTRLRYAEIMALSKQSGESGEK